ncbi:MAG TPA: SCO family protein [Pirellulaceae bacterium]|nr:SCO family protein [Pirellulaceae bacterium]HMO92254.1 SCO family protein [Pirellulaceae bacterium]HMP70070.1 SCO family protein [Pirellulaceae bacterium]
MFSRRLYFEIVVALSLLLNSMQLAAQVVFDQPPAIIEGVRIEQKLGEQIPLDLTFTDENNNYVNLGRYFQGKKPVLLSFNYANCPKLCSIQLVNLANALQTIRLEPGRDFELVIVSIDPLEQSHQSAELKRKYLALYGKLNTEKGWHVLTGKRQSLAALSEACGYFYKYIPEQKIYSHQAAFIFCSPDGKIARYLDGLDNDLRFKLDKALIEAGEGKVGSIVDKVLYFSGCFVFDQHQGRYTFAMMNIMRLGGGLTVVCLLMWLVPAWIRISRRSKRERDAGSNSGGEIDAVTSVNRQV